MRILTLLSIATILLAAPCYAEPSKALRPLIRFSCPANHDSDTYKILHYLYSQAFDRLGYNFMMLQRTSERSLTENRHNIMDGDCARIHDLGKDGKSMVRIDVAIRVAEVSAWGYQTDLQINSESDLQKKQVKIGFLKGAVVFNNYVKENNISQYKTFTTQAEAIKHLFNGTISVLLSTAESIEIGLSRQRELGYPNKLLSLHKTELYPYLSQKNTHLKTPLENELKRVLKEMKQFKS